MKKDETPQCIEIRFVDEKYSVTFSPVCEEFRCCIKGQFYLEEEANF